LGEDANENERDGKGNRGRILKGNGKEQEVEEEKGGGREAAGGKDNKVNNKGEKIYEV